VSYYSLPFGAVRVVIGGASAPLSIFGIEIRVVDAVEIASYYGVSVKKS